MNTLKRLQLEDHVDMVVCGDDAGSMPKPHPHNALSICRTLDVDPQVSFIDPLRECSFIFTFHSFFS